MYEPPAQMMQGTFSVFVRWVSGVKQGANGPYCRIRSCIGKQWSTLQIPMEIAPDVKKGDFVVVSGSMAALTGQDGAEPYLFVDQIVDHLPAEEIADSVPGTPSSNRGSRWSGADKAPSEGRYGQGAARHPAANNAQRSDKRSSGYGSNRAPQEERERPVCQNANGSPGRPVERQPSGYQNNRRPQSGYGSNRQNQSVHSQEQQPRQQPQSQSAQSGYASNSRPPSSPPPQTARVRGYGGYARNRV